MINSKQQLQHSVAHMCTTAVQGREKTDTQSIIIDFEAYTASCLTPQVTYVICPAELAIAKYQACRDTYHIISVHGLLMKTAAIFTQQPQQSSALALWQLSVASNLC